MNWHNSDRDGGISYATTSVNGENRSIHQVVFRRYNTKAHVEEMVHVHWSEAFKWADADSCGWLGVTAVIWSDGTMTYASGLYFGQGHPDQYSRERSGLSAVVVGCYGSVMLKRERRPKRDQHGFPIQ